MRAVTIACQALPYLGDWYWTLPYLGGVQVCQDTALSGRGWSIWILPYLSRRLVLDTALSGRGLEDLDCAEHYPLWAGFG